MTLLNNVEIPALVNQIDDRTCGHACLAMIAGWPIEDVIAAVGTGPVTTSEERLFLALHGILTHPIAIESPYTWGVYLVSAPSLNLPPKMHRVVVYADPEVKEGDPWVVLDPQSGRKGRKFYERCDFNGDVMAFNEILLLSRPANIDLARYIKSVQSHG